MANSCTRLCGIFKGLSQDWGRADFSKKSEPQFLMTTYRMKLLLDRSISLDGILKVLQGYGSELR